MFQIRFKRALLLAALPLLSAPTFAADSADLKALRAEIARMREAYESRINALEQRLTQAETSSGQAIAQATSAETQAVAARSAAASAQQQAARPAALGSEAAFNPGISVILSGLYTNLQRNPGKTPYAITGFVPSLGEVAPPPRSFSLGESELVIAGNIDPHFRGQLILALPPEEGASPQVEEGFIQTIGLGSGRFSGLNLKAGRFLSGIGYMNEQHAHAWDFSDAPLAYKAFFGNQLRGDGVQLKWLAPTDTFLEVGVEAGRGGNFPGTERNKNGFQSGTVFVHLGDDWDTSNSWRGGLSWLQSRPDGRGYQDTDSSGFASMNSFSGKSSTWIADFVWKWAPQGNNRETSLTLQGEYFQRKEDGTLGIDSTAAGGAVSSSDSYRSRQSGWYGQAVYKFAPEWRIGYRYDRLDHGTVNLGAALNPADLPVLARHDPSRNTLMLDWSPSEFSRVRLQYARDDARLGISDNQVWLHYIMSLGAHGAHKY